MRLGRRVTLAGDAELDEGRVSEALLDRYLPARVRCRRRVSSIPDRAATRPASIRPVPLMRTPASTSSHEAACGNSARRMQAALDSFVETSSSLQEPGLNFDLAEHGIEMPLKEQGQETRNWTGRHRLNLQTMPSLTVTLLL